MDMKASVWIKNCGYVTELVREQLFDADGSCRMHKIRFPLQRPMIYEEMGIIHL